MTLQQLHYAITISEIGSMNKAAENLYISQPSLTSAIKDLEKEIGIQIFHRSGRGVSLTNDGLEFISYARQVYQQYEILQDKYNNNGGIKKKFGVSAQHYSFAVKTFVEMVKKFNTLEYEFAIRETKTRDVIHDVTTLKSEIGILYLNDFNRKAITKILGDNDLEFHHLIDCNAYIYLWKGHPLAQCKSIQMSQLEDFPCISFEQGDYNSFYYAEELLSTNEYSRIIKVCDRATALNLMVGLNAYTLCSGIICEELNGTDYIAVPLELEGENGQMEVGYINKKNIILSSMADIYINEIKSYLNRFCL